MATSAGLTGGSGDWNNGAARLSREPEPEPEPEGEGEREARRTRFCARSVSISLSLDALRRRLSHLDDDNVASVGDKDEVELGGEG